MDNTMIYPRLNAHRKPISTRGLVFFLLAFSGLMSSPITIGLMIKEHFNWSLIAFLILCNLSLFVCLIVIVANGLHEHLLGYGPMRSYIKELEKLPMYRLMEMEQMREFCVEEQHACRVVLNDKHPGWSRPDNG